MKSPRRQIVLASALLMTGLIAFFAPRPARAGDDEDFRAASAEGAALKAKGDYAGSAKRYERAVEIANRTYGADEAKTAIVEGELAEMYSRLGQQERAAPLLEHSLKICTDKLGADDPATAQIMHYQASVLLRAGKNSEAEKLLLKVIKIREAKLGKNHPDVATSINNLAIVYLNMGEYAKAETNYQRSLEIATAAGGPESREAIRALSNLAVLYRAMGRFDRAEAIVERSLKINESTLGPDHPDVAIDLENLAVICQHLGKYPRAEELYQRALKINETRLGPEHPSVARCLADLGTLYIALGQYAKAEPLFQRALQILEAKSGPESADLAETLVSAAALYIATREFDKAEPLLQRSVKILEAKLGPDHPRVADALCNLGALYLQRGRQTHDFGDAESLFNRSVKIDEAKFGADNSVLLAPLNDLAVLYVGLGRFAEAEPLYLRANRIREARLGPDHPDVARYGLTNLAMLHGAMGQWETATDEADRARRSIRRYVASTLPMLSEQEQLQFLKNVDEVGFSLALSLGVHEHGNPRIAARSAEWLINGKALAQQALGDRALLARDSDDPAVAGPVKQLLSVRDQLATLTLTAPKPGTEAARRGELAELTKREEELSRTVGRAAGHAAGAESWIGVDAVRKALPKDALLVEIIRLSTATFQVKSGDTHGLPPHYFAWIIPAAGDGEIAVVDLGDAQKIDGALQTARTELESGAERVAAESEAAAEKHLQGPMRILAALVFDPLLPHFGRAKHLILSPDASLWLVPWAALPLADGRYAIERFDIRYVVTGRDLADPGPVQEFEPSAPVVFANPDYDLAPADHGSSPRAKVSAGQRTQAKRLPGTAAEAKAVKPFLKKYANADPLLYLDKDALKSTFNTLQGPRVLVLSTHGFFMPDIERFVVSLEDLTPEGTGTIIVRKVRPVENPLLRCGLLLAGCNRAPAEVSGSDDGIVTGLEILGTDLRGTEMVVLSACETGLGDVHNGEGVAGLRQAFQLAGAKAVVATLWSIPDRETASLMSDFFANLAAGQTKSDALRGAQLSMIKARRARGGAAHPLFWAAFTLTGQ